MTLTDVMAQTRAGTGLAGGTAALAPLDVVYVVRAEEQNEDLRYSLRALATNLPHAKVYIAGYCPTWLKGVIPVPRNQEGQSNQENSNLNLLEACKHPDLADDFIFMNDDFYVMEPTLEVPAMHQGDLDDIITRYKSNNRMGQAYSLIATRTELRRIIPSSTLYSYELHMPMVMNKQKVLTMFEEWRRPVMSLRPRTMYGNLYQIEGAETQDVKTTSRQEGPYISTVYGETDDDAHQLIRERYNTPSQYERAAN